MSQCHFYQPAAPTISKVNSLLNLEYAIAILVQASNRRFHLPT